MYLSGMENANNNTTAINKAIKKHIINIMRGNGKLKYSKKIIRNNEFILECLVSVISESTCEIGKMVETKFNVDFDKYESRISLIQY